MKPKLQKIHLLSLAPCLLVFCCMGFTQQMPGVSPLKPALGGNQSGQGDVDFDHSRIVEVRGEVQPRKGNDLTGVAGIFFAIYDQQYGGVPLWQEVQNVEVDARGHFNALVGSNAVGGIPSDLFTPEKTLWVGEQVLLPGEVERPRFRLMSGSHGLVAGSAGMAPAKRKSSGRSKK